MRAPNFIEHMLGTIANQLIFLENRSEIIGKSEIDQSEMHVVASIEKDQSDMLLRHY